MQNYKIIDNFLTYEHFEKLCKLNLKIINSNEIRVYHNKIDKFDNLKSSCLSENLLRDLHKEYNQRAMNILNELAPQKLKLYDYSEFHIVETGKNYKFPIHRDTPNKLLSGVIYLYPEKNKGTFVYENRYGKNKKRSNGNKIEHFFFQIRKLQLAFVRRR